VLRTVQFHEKNPLQMTLQYLKLRGPLRLNLNLISMTASGKRG